MVRQMTILQKNPVFFYLRRGCLLLIVALLLLPSNASADPSLFLSIVEELETLNLNLKSLKDLKLSAKLKTDKKGKMVFQCLNLSVPVSSNPFERMGNWLKLSQIEVKAVKKGVVANVSFSF
jgi:hypothetical protein